MSINAFLWLDLHILYIVFSMHNTAFIQDSGWVGKRLHIFVTYSNNRRVIFEVLSKVKCLWYDTVLKEVKQFIWSNS